jgi:Na+/melibiose symporter-like transporter
MAVLVRTFITFYEVPSTALVAELTDRYDERTSILSFRFFFGWWGGLAMAVLAYGVFLQPDAAHSVGVLNRAGYTRYGLAAALIMATAILVSAVGTHRHIAHLPQPPPRRARDLGRSLAELRATLLNRSFLILFASAVFGAMAAGLTAGLNVYFNTFFWELTSDQITVIVLANFASAAVALVAAPRLSLRMGKKPAAIAVALTAITLAPVPIVLRLLGAFPANGSPALLPALLVFNATEVTLIIMSSILVAAMVADVVEDSEVKTGRRSEGLFFAARSFVQKVVSGIGIFASTLILAAIDFPRGAKPSEVDPEAVRNLGLVYAPTLVLLYLVALTILCAYPISRAKHEENLHRLGRRAVG